MMIAIAHVMVVVVAVVVVVVCATIAVAAVNGVGAVAGGECGIRLHFHVHIGRVVVQLVGESIRRIENDVIL